MDFTDETIPMPIFLWTLTANGLFFSVILPISLRYVPPNSLLSEL